MIDRNKLKQEFIDKTKLKIISVEELPADASFRTYSRLKTIDNSYILMDAPPKREDVKPFLTVAKFLHEKNVSAPKIFFEDRENGFILMEDLGLHSYYSYLEKADDIEEEKRLYRLAIELLIKIQKQPVLDNIVPYYEDNMLWKEVLIFTEWYIPTLNGEKLSKKQLEEFEIIWRHLLQIPRLIPESFVFRDYHAQNLMYMEDRLYIDQVGVLDFQDAVVGSPIYDIVSLLEDARRDVDPEVVYETINHYLSVRTDISRKEFLASYAILGAQRNLKIIGIFARKAIRDKNSSYLKLLPRVWRYIDENLKHPLLFPLKNWLDKAIAKQVRSTDATKVPSKMGV